MAMDSIDSWTPASRRRRWLSVYVDYLLLGAPIAVILWAIAGLFPGIRTVWLPLQILLFLMIEALLLKGVRWSPGQKALGIETVRAPWEPIEPGDPKGVPVVDPWLLRNERWWTILPGILFVLDGAKLLVRWTEWSRTMPFFGILLEGGSAAAFQVGLGVVEIAAGVALLRLRRWAVWVGAAYAIVMLTSFATSGPVLPEYVQREAVARRAAQGREVRAEEIQFLERYIPAAALTTGVISLLWMGVLAVRIRAAWNDPVMPFPPRGLSGALAIAGAIALAAAGCTRERTATDGTSAARAPFDESKLVDLTYPFDSTTLYWSPDETFRMETVSRGMTPGGYWYASNRFCASEHGGTHLDAPIHFGEGKSGTHAIPLARLAGPACVVDVSATCAQNPDYRLTVEDIRAWESEHGPLPEGAIVLMRSGWGARWPDRMRYFGAPAMTETETYHFPGFSKEAAEFLTRERAVDAVGLDTPSLDHGGSRDFMAHRVFAAADVPGLENVANLDRLPARGAWVLALPISIRDGTGGPARIVAFLP